MNGDDDEPVSSLWALLSGRERRPAYETEILDGMQQVQEICERLVQHGDPAPQLQAAISLVHQAASVARRVGREGEPPDIVGRIAAGRLALLGFAVPHRGGEGLLIRMRDRWAAIFLEVQRAASHLPSGDDQRNDLAAAVADRVMMIAGCETPPDAALVRAAIEAEPEPRPEDDALLRLVAALGLPSTDAGSLAKSIRNALPFVVGLVGGTGHGGGHGT